MLLLPMLGAVALVLAAIGIHGALPVGVAQPVRKFGILRPGAAANAAATRGAQILHAPCTLRY
jgi:hypothetical protein